MQKDKQKHARLRTEGHVPRCRGEEGRLGSRQGQVVTSLRSQKVEDFVLWTLGATGEFKTQYHCLIDGFKRSLLVALVWGRHVQKGQL